MRIVGIDPGAKGGLALLDDGILLEVVQMPHLTIKRGKTNKTRVEGLALAETLRRWHDERPIDLAVTENVGGHEGQSASAAFNFGKDVGAPYFILVGMGVRVEEVAPSRWMRALEVPPGKDKDGSFFLANKLFPGWARTWAAVVGNGAYDLRSGRAEAALIAFYGNQHYGDGSDARPAESPDTQEPLPVRRGRAEPGDGSPRRSRKLPARRPSLFD